eukprot:TRINITY_DN6011_c1_g1_i1.p1 TRINITY_DN6011_c1_g1~~TRINITY_DN6011_c1_g1_i1.p1  ORF type:complete len:855 (+),score=336.73 TRINITY_DN6011_c1_g1_i1:57-2621(+)
MSLTEILLAANDQSIDGTRRNVALRQIQEAEKGNIEHYIGSLMQELSDESKPEGSRILAGTLLKNTMVSRDAGKRKELALRWLNVNVDTRAQVKSMVLTTLSSPKKHARVVAATVAAHILRIELPTGQWQDFVPQLCQVCQQPSNPNQREAALMCLGFICEECDHEYLLKYSGNVVQSVYSAMTDTQDNIRLEGTKALCNSLEFIGGVMENEDQRNHIMKVICETASRNHQPVASKETRENAMECLVKLVALYYDKIGPYMQGLFSLTCEAVKQDEEEVALQGLEFWTSMCEVEQEIIDNSITDVKIMYYVKGATKFLIPLLWECLNKQDEHAGEDDWNICFAGGTCLQAISSTIGDPIVEHVMPLVLANIQSPEWRKMEAATLAFGSILEGTTSNGPLASYLAESVQPLLAHMGHPNHLIKESTAWCIGRMAEFHCEIIKAVCLQPVLECMVNTLRDPEPRIASKGCYAILNLAQGCGGWDDEDTTNEMSPFFLPTSSALLAVVDRQDAGSSGLRSSAWEALGALVGCCAQDCLSVVRDLLPVLLDRLEQTLAVTPTDENMLKQINDMQGLLCGLLHFVCRKLKSDVRPFVQRMMTDILTLLKNDNSTVQEEAFMAVGAIANALGEDFAVYLESFFPLLCKGLKNFEAASVCTIAVGTLSDVLSAVKTKIAPCCDDMMMILLQNLGNGELDKDVKPAIISTFGDVALNIDAHFEKYLPVVMQVISTAAVKVNEEVQKNPDNEDLVSYQNELRENIFTSYTGILMGLKKKKSLAFKDYVPQIIAQLQEVSRERASIPPGTYCAAVSLVGDLLNVYGQSVKASLPVEISQLVDEGSRHEDETVREAVQWAMGNVK